MRARVLTLAWAKIGAASLALGGCAASQAQPPSPICGQLLSLARESNAPAQRSVTYESYDRPDAIFAVRCDSGADTSLRDFCVTTIQNTSHEFLDAFAYDVAGCVADHGSVRLLSLGHESTGLRQHPRNLELMEGRIASTDVILRATERGFALTLRHR